VDARAHDEASFRDRRECGGTSSPAGAKMIAASRSSGRVPERAQAAPSQRAKACASSSPSRVTANTLRPCGARPGPRCARRRRSRRGRASRRRPAGRERGSR
jgi:hypothetical protein